MQALKQIEQGLFKAALPQVQSGDTVRVHQLIREGGKQRVQVFEGVVIRTVRPAELTAAITVRRIASGVGVEKTFLLHSPNVQKVEVLRRSKVRRNFLSYLRGRRGKAARLHEVGFDKAAANAANVAKPESEPVAAAADEEPADTETTEINEELAAEPEVEVSTEELAKRENKEAAQSEPAADENAETDEELLPASEAESGTAKAQPAES